MDNEILDLYAKAIDDRRVAWNIFNHVTDPDLIEAAIFRMREAEIRCKYFAKELNRLANEKAVSA